MDDHEKYLAEQAKQWEEQQRAAAAAAEQARREQHAQAARDAMQKMIDQQAKPLGC